MDSKRAPAKDKPHDQDRNNLKFLRAGEMIVTCCSLHLSTKNVLAILQCF